MEHQPRTSRMTPRDRPATLHDRTPVPIDPEVRGTVLGARYRIEDCIGSGAMGVVWTAWDRRLRRTVAVKQLSTALSSDPTEARVAQARAMREGRIAARVVHPRAIAVFDVVTHAGMPWLVMEYLPSRSLAAVLAQEGPLAPARVARIGAQIADALSAVHDAGIVHGDVKPGNLLLTEDGVAKLTDFGVSRASWDTTTTGSNSVAGTPGYFAPEVARGHEPTPASDVFSLGATLYAAVENELVCGRLDNTLAVLHAMAEGCLRPTTRAGVLERPLAAMLRVDAQLRPDTRAVRAVLDRSGLAAPDVPAEGALAAAGVPATTPHATAPATHPGAPDAVLPPSGAAVAVGTGAAPETHRDRAVAATPVAAAPGPTTPGRRVGAGLRRRRTAVVAAGAAVILAAGVGAGLAAVGNSGPPVAAPVPSAPSESAAPAPVSEPQATRTTEPPIAAAPLSPGAGPDETTAPLTDLAVSEADVRATVVDYYGGLPGNVDGAWAVLSAQARDASGGFDTYRRFWGGISSVSAGSVSVDGDVARTTLQFTTSSGRMTRESYTFRVGRAADGRLVIESAGRRGSDAV